MECKSKQKFWKKKKTEEAAAAWEHPERDGDKRLFSIENNKSLKRCEWDTRNYGVLAWMTQKQSSSGCSDLLLTVFSKVYKSLLTTRLSSAPSSAECACSLKLAALSTAKLACHFTECAAVINFAMRHILFLLEVSKEFFNTFKSFTFFRSLLHCD